MSPKMRTLQSEIAPLTGDQVESQGLASNSIPAYGWKTLITVPGEDPEVSVVRSVNAHSGATALHCGSRNQSYDLEIVSKLDKPGKPDPYLAAAGLSSGKYEVKSLWRKTETQAFDRRFKIGRRGERVYGRRDAEIKSFAAGLEDEIDAIIQNFVDEGSTKSASKDAMTRFVTETHDFITNAFERRHSKAFSERISRLAKASLNIPTLVLRAHAVSTGGVQGHDIVRGFDDIEGIFIVAGPIYTLVTKTEMSQFLTFDSASAEGPKLRLVSVIPSEQNKLRKEKGKKKT